VSGDWPNGGWYWKNYSTTKRASRALLKRGLVEQYTYQYTARYTLLRGPRTETLTAYRITDAGIAVVKQHFPLAAKYKT
jgi:hypothetical protein